MTAESGQEVLIGCSFWLKSGKVEQQQSRMSRTKEASGTEDAQDSDTDQSPFEHHYSRTANAFRRTAGATSSGCHCFQFR
jgi:hypothetical protein